MSDPNDAAPTSGKPHVCPRCEGPGQPDHECPYKADVNNDSDFKCNCCDDCAYECAMDI